jgi:hypothetical protein
MNGQTGTKRSFLVRIGVVLLGGLAIMAVVTPLYVWARGSSTSPVVSLASENNWIGSYGLAGGAIAQPMMQSGGTYTVMKVVPGPNTPQYVSDPLKDKRGVVLLVYVKGASDDEAMLANFEKLKAKYEAQGSFFSYEAADVSKTGDLLAQLKVSQPPVLAVISGDGSVYQEYTGWIDEQTMSQVLANALR